jgi:DNA-binding beta-propeller fold protein YncE
VPFVPSLPPQQVPVFGGFDYMTVDATRRRVYAAHTGSRALLIVDADSGKVVGQVRVGPMHGVAVDPETGHVFTGNGEDDSVSEVDPVALKVLRTVDVGGHVDAIAYDPAKHRIYADEDDGARVFVIDAQTMKSVATITMPGSHLEYLAIDPQTHEVFQNITDRNEFVVIDPETLKITRTVATPQLTSNHPLQYDPGFRHVLVGGANGMIAVFDPSGTFLNQAAIQPHVDQCDLDAAAHTLACAGNGEVTLMRDDATGAPVVVARAPVPRGVHTVAIDPTTQRVWVVWSSQDPTKPGDFVQPFSLTPTP